MTNEELVLLIQQGHTEKLEELWSQNKKIIRMFAGEFHAGDLEEDLVQESYFGLLEAAQKFDATKGYKFMTYAAYHIRQRMRRFIFKAMPGARLPEHMIMKVRKYERFCADFYLKNGREPSDLEARVILHMPDIKAVKKAAMDPTSLDKDAGEDGSAVLEDFYAVTDDSAEDVIDGVFHEELKRDLWQTVDQLPDRQKEAIIEYYKAGKTYRKIAKELGCSVEYVRATLVKALRELRSKKHSKRLQPYYQELYGMGLSGTGLTQFMNTWTSSTERAAMKLLEGHEGNRVVSKQSAPGMGPIQSTHGQRGTISEGMGENPETGCP